MKRPLTVLLLALAAAFAHADDVETIVCFRHGEKTATELGQLSVIGLNRSLELPDVLAAKYGTPQFLFAPDPDKDLAGGREGAPKQYYLRPLATIEPTAIKLGMPVNTEFGFKNIAGLEQELLKPKYRHALIFVAWEHRLLAEFIARIDADVGKTPLKTIDWTSPDYDSLYVIRIQHGATGDTIAVTHDREGLDHPSATFPSPGK
jgi:hypothetical protein